MLARLRRNRSKGALIHDSEKKGAIQTESEKQGEDCKVLLLGCHDAGKSTIFKQMKVIEQNGFTYEELLSFRFSIYVNLIDSIQAIIKMMHKMELEPESLEIKSDIERVSNYKVTDDETFKFSIDIAQAIHDIWNDPIIQVVTRLSARRSDFYLIDLVEYFIPQVLRISQPEYVPSEMDVLRCQTPSRGCTEDCFNIGNLRVRMLDVGGLRSQRKKWIHFFESVASIIFVLSLSEYNQVLLEDGNQNRMAESLVLFEAVVNSRWFSRTSIILFMNKIDMFTKKLPKIPLSDYYPDYTGGADVNKAAKYILWLFMQKNRQRLSIFPHLTHAIDTSSMRLVFELVGEDIIESSLKNSSIL